MPLKNTYYYPGNSSIDRIVYLEEGVDSNYYHREDGPAYVSYHENGKEYLIQYFINDKLHREDGPAHIEYRDDGSLLTKQWYRHGELHNENYPARITSVPDGFEAEFFTDGQFICKRSYSTIEEMELHVLNDALHEHDIHIILNDNKKYDISFINENVTIWGLTKDDMEETIRKHLENVND